MRGEALKSPVRLIYGDGLLESNIDKSNMPRRAAPSGVRKGQYLIMTMDKVVAPSLIAYRVGRLLKQLTEPFPNS